MKPAAWQVGVGLAGCVVLWWTAACARAAAEPEAPTAARARADGFPMGWAGRWRGEAESGDGVGPGQRFTMELVVAPTDRPDRFGWTIIYEGASGRQERPYSLIVKDAGAGRYAIDEGNGIVLESRLIGETLHEHFLVQGARITSRTARVGAGTAEDRLEFELLSMAESDAAASGGAGGVPEVKSWVVRTVQRATLRRVDGGSPAKAPTGGDAAATAWSKMPTERYPGKQDDIFFVDPQVGYYVNGAGKIFKTTDGGATWALKLHKPGTYFRCIAFVDGKVGLAGNIGPGYFPNVTDATPLYRTEDGGETWAAVEGIEGPPVVGLCALEVVREPFVNAGVLETAVRVYAAGRVGGPAALIFSDDLGKTWRPIDLGGKAAMAFDVHFFNRRRGWLAAASDADVTKSNAVILTTEDGGATWREAYRSSRPYELTWKISAPTADVGYVTIQSYDPDPAASKRYVAKTTDGGRTWSEVPLVDDAKVRQFGVAFVTPEHGFVGAVPRGYETRDGGATWAPAGFGNAVNKIRLLEGKDGIHLFAIGVEAHRALVAPPAKP